LLEEEGESRRQLTINDYLRILYRGRWIILGSFVIVMAITIYKTVNALPVYKASTTILIESTGAMERSVLNMNYFGNQSTLITNQLEILKSRKLAERVIMRLDASYMRDSLSIFKPDKEGNIKSLQGMAGWLLGRMEVNNRKDTDIIEITFSSNYPFESAYLCNAIAQEFQRLNEETNRVEITELRRFLEKQGEIKGDELKLAEENFRDFQERENVADLDAETSQIVDRYAQAQAMLEQAQVELDAFQERKQSLVAHLDERKQNLAQDLSEISSPYLISLQNQLAQAVAERTKFIIAIESEVSNPQRLSYENQIKAYDEKIKALRQKLEEESDKIKSSSMVNDPFKLSQELISNLLEVDSEIKSLTAKISALKDIVNEYDSRIQNLPDKILTLARLFRDKKAKEEIYIMMVKKLEETKIQEAGQSGNVRIIDEALIPSSPVSPNKRMNLILGVLIGLGLGIGLTFVIEYFDNSIKTIDEVERLGFTLLAAIPRIEREKLEKKIERKWESFELLEAKSIESRLVTHFDPKSPISEAYRTLRTNLQFSKIEKVMKTILITSSGPKEGKSTTVANLAITLAQLGSKVALVDTDLRRPVLHSIFGIEKEDGLTNYMMGNVSFEKILKSTFMENLTLVSCGVLPPNPSELLGSEKMENLLKKLRLQFDFILFDSPPVIAVTDAAILSTKIDSTLLVISAGHTNREAVIRAKSLLENVNTKVLGAILNNVDIEGTYGTNYYYYYYHYYYGKNPKKGRRIGKSRGLRI
jgi:capsular exopolysaccharide synthesis family protein